jgi:hypothetical protein
MMTRKTTVGELIAFLTSGTAHQFDPNGDFEEWWLRLCAIPANVFALTSAILYESGLYRIATTPTQRKQQTDQWLRAIENVTLTNSCCDGAPAKDSEGGRMLLELGEVLRGTINELVMPDDNDPKNGARKALLTLHILADEASKGFGISEHLRRLPDPDQQLPPQVRTQGLERLHAHGTLSCLDTSKIRILPKKHTPQVGITLRSLSFHLAAARGEVQVKWTCATSVDPDSTTRRAKKAKPEHRLTNLLLIPWPFNIEAGAFRGMNPDVGAHAYEFDYAPPQSPDDLIECLAHIQNELNLRRLCVHGIVLPELALAADGFDKVRESLAKSESTKNAFILGGVHVPGSGERPPTNEAWFALNGAPIQQQKHHKWCLDESQIRQYHLASRLLPQRGARYWERINIGPRTLNFVHWRPSFTICHLVCEDLARVEPVSDVIRAVGPNLVVALLLDGPQMERRWPGRYASIFADDPGSSVLTLSALGMVKRSVVPGEAPSRIVALWKDQLTGTRELRLSEGGSALLLSLCTNDIREWTYDGRSDGDVGVVTFGGVEEIRATKPMD